MVGLKNFKRECWNQLFFIDMRVILPCDPLLLTLQIDDDRMCCYHDHQQFDLFELL